MMSKRLHVSEVASARFAVAITASLKNLIESGNVFTVSDVIARARYDDGAKVGATTIYAKNSSGGLVHEKLLSQVKSASLASKARASRKETVSAASANQMAQLGAFKQLVEQESQIQTLESAIASLRHQLASAQHRCLVSLSCLNLLCGGAALEVVRPMRELERLLGDEALVSRLKAEAQTLADSCGRLVRTK